MEKKVVKALLAAGERNQDIHALINIARFPTVNFGRISTVKNTNIQPASNLEVIRFKLNKSLADLKTGLTPFADERLVKSRESMLLAVHIFNMPLLHFKIEMFPVLANISWTYLLHEFYDRNKISILHKDGSSLLLSQMLNRSDSPLSKGCKDNLLALKLIRDSVEHKLLDSFGEDFYGIFQANCLNYENTICSLFGDRLSLGRELNYALQFSKLSMQQARQLQNSKTPGIIQTIDQELGKLFSDKEMSDPEFKFKVSYSLEKSSKGEAHFNFSNKLDTENLPHNILVQKVSSDENWPYKPSKVVAKVCDLTKKKFTSQHHTNAWKKFGARPRNGAKNPTATKPSYCTYNPAHSDYTYSDEWISFLVSIVNDDTKFSELKSFKNK